MKSLKFRAWSKSGASYLRERVSPYNWLCNSFSRDDLIWQQFTGHLDKNGKEIYEGDLIDFNSCNMYTNLSDLEYRKAIFDKREVRWDGYEWAAWDDIYGFFSFRDIKEIEVVGNIFEKI